MRFEGPELGDWEVDIGHFIQHRFVTDSIIITVVINFLCRILDEGVCEMRCTLNIDANVLRVSRGYKYVVYSPIMVVQNDCFEYLHSFAGRTSRYRNPNRCLKINRATLLNSMLACRFM